MKYTGEKIAELRWEQWKESFERAYGKNTFVSESWLRGMLAAQQRQPAIVEGQTLKNQNLKAQPLKAQPLKAQPLEDTLEQIRADLGDCTRCKLSQKRTNIVFGEGSPTAKLMFVGEGPGENEDLEGRPFVGKAGQLLDKIVEAMGYKRSDVYIANVVKCRPPGNRAPEPDEAGTCSPFLFRQIDTIKPEVIVALGGTALKNLFGEGAKITKMRGNWTEFRGVPVMPTFHPAYLLRNPDAKRDVWEDMKKVKTVLETKVED